jgi:hypothetical protein
VNDFNAALVTNDEMERLLPAVLDAIAPVQATVAPGGFPTGTDEALQCDDQLSAELRERTAQDTAHRVAARQARVVPLLEEARRLYVDFESGGDDRCRVAKRLREIAQLVKDLDPIATASDIAQAAVYHGRTSHFVA